MKTEGLQATEAECAEGRTAPRVSLADIEANIAASYFFTGEQAVGNVPIPAGANLGILTICLLVLANGFTILGKSAPAAPENFDAKLGQKLAYEDAVRQVWPLMGYELRERLHRATLPAGPAPEGGSRLIQLYESDARELAAYLNLICVGGETRLQRGLQMRDLVEAVLPPLHDPE